MEDDFIFKILSEVDEKGFLKHRESSKIEFKENFNWSNFAKYAKTMASFANAKGGYLIFGIKDSPRKPIGIKKEKFDNIKQEKITNFLLEHFSPELTWEMKTMHLKEKFFGIIYTEEADEKPVICKKDKDNIIKSGEIYYRYRARSSKIQFPELKKIIQEYREKERYQWMKLIEKIAQTGPKNIALVDLLNGSISTSLVEKSQLIIDRKLLEELKEKVTFIEEGHFSETDGEPTLKIIGEVKPVNGIVVPNLDPNKDYPFLQKDLAEKLGIRLYDVQVLIWKLNLKGNKKYHLPIKGSKNILHKFSKYALKELQEHLETIDQRILKQYSKEYQKRRKK